MLASVAVNYGLAIMIDRFPKGRVPGLVLSIVFNLGALYVFKYFNFRDNWLISFVIS